MELITPSHVEWDVSLSEQAKYKQIFLSLSPDKGLLSGDKVKPVLLDSKLPVDVLGHIWDLSDYDKDGLLDEEEFIVAMHLVYKALEKSPVPPTLPSNLIPPSKRIKDGSTMGSIKPTNVAVSWVISDDEKQKYDEMFKAADTDLDGYVNGQEIKQIFLKSGLQQNTLAHIWNLCDTNASGKLNSEEFALAVHLINNKLQNIEVPEYLTPEMVPPSMRSENLESVQTLNKAAMKELDMIQKEIDEMRREKMKLENERAQIEADIKIRNGEVQSLQKELDVISATVTKLENQKTEAQKKLDELDDKKTKFYNDTESLKEKCNEENNQKLKLQQTISSTESTVKNQEEEVKLTRDNLSVLRKEEIELEQKIETCKTQLEQLTTDKKNNSFSQLKDPFGTDPFIPQDIEKPKVPLHSKQKKAAPPPRPPAPSAAFAKHSTTPVDSFNTKDNNEDAFAQFNPTKFNEDDQLAWATRKSQAEWEREKKRQAQEQADLELALELSKQK